MSQYAKPWLTYDEQLDLLESRGLVINDREGATIYLKSVGYYRLSGYWYPFRMRSSGHREGIDIPSDQLQPGISFDEIAAVCNFDRKLRVSIWEAIERIEIALRVALAYQMGTHGAFAYLDPANLSLGCHAPSQHHPEMSHYEEFCKKMQDSIQGSKEDFVNHFRTSYDGRLPIWVAIEVWDFGTLSRFYQIMKTVDKMAVAGSFGITKPSTLASWLQALNILRNYCAHHSRLSRRNFVIIPGLPKIPDFSHVRQLQDRDKHRLYPLLCTLSFLLRTVSPNSSWQNSMIELFRTIDGLATTNLGDYGIPIGWHDDGLWTKNGK